MKVLAVVLSLILALYAAVCRGLYLKQESLLFFPARLPADYRFRFPGRFTEQWITAPDGTRLHGLLFQADTVPANGLIFYLHGNGGALDSWGSVAPLYTRQGYDLFLLDYRGYGKSQGRISSEAQLHTDVEAAYQHLRPRYPESQTVVLGYSLGTGLAARLAAHHRPRLLMLQAPYYSLRDVASHHFPWVPGWLVRYPLRTHEQLPRVQVPIVVFHGDQDEVIPYESARKLRPLLKPTDRFVTLPDAGHNGMTDNTLYQQVLAEVL